MSTRYMWSASCFPDVGFKPLVSLIHGCQQFIECLCFLARLTIECTTNRPSHSCHTAKYVEQIWGTVSLDRTLDVKTTYLSELRHEAPVWDRDEASY